MKVRISENPVIEKDINSIYIPDLWHLALAQSRDLDKEAILEVWHLCHKLKKHIQDIAASEK